MTNQFHRAPRAHQLRDFHRFKNEPYWALWYDPRVGKTKVVFDIWQHHIHSQHLNTLIVISYPSGVKYVWAEEIQKDLPPALLTQTMVIIWQAGKTILGKRREVALAARTHPGPVLISLNCEALLTEDCEKYLYWIIKARKTMLVADESSWAKSWSARTQKLLALGRQSNVAVKACLDGTPVDEGPTEIWHPTQFLSPYLLGFSNKATFKARYLITEERVAYRTGHVYPVVLGHRHLEELQAKMNKFGVRVRREDVSDAPPKIYQSQYFELSLKQREVYDQLRDEYAAELKDKEVVTAADVLLRMTRLQMIARNYWPPSRIGQDCTLCYGTGTTNGDECPQCSGIGIEVVMTELKRIDKTNPALTALFDTLETAALPAVIWCRFRQDANDVHTALHRKQIPTLLYTGEFAGHEREARYQQFQAGSHNIVATLGSGLTRGKDLSMARTLIYYSNDFSLRTRRQSEDRAEAIDRNIATEIIDLIAVDTRDQDVVTALREKRALAAYIMDRKGMFNDNGV